MKTPKEQAIEIADELAQASRANLAGNSNEAQQHLEAAGALIGDLIESLEDAHQFPTH